MERDDSTESDDFHAQGGSDGPSAGGSPPRRERFRPGFAWGLAAGAIIIVGLLVSGSLVQTAILTRQSVNEFGSAPMADIGQMPAVVISPVRAGQDWFSVDASGTGTLEGWTDGSSGTGDMDIPGTIGYVDVSAVGAVGEVKVKHSASVFITPKTRVFINSRPATAEDVFRDDLVGDRELKVKFHRVGQDIVADTIHASEERDDNPMY